MEPAQLSFIDLVTVKPVEPPNKPPSPWELMAAGLQVQQMATGDIIDRLRELTQR